MEDLVSIRLHGLSLLSLAVIGSDRIVMENLVNVHCHDLGHIYLASYGIVMGGVGEQTRISARTSLVHARSYERMVLIFVHISAAVWLAVLLR